MKINIEKKYNTNLYQLLNNVKEEEVYYNLYNLRHPLAIYNITSENVFRRVSNVLDILDKEPEKINDEYLLFIESIDGAIDNMYNIIKCFYKSDMAIKAKFAKEWLKKATNGEIDKYEQAIQEKTFEIKYISNKLKHENGRLSKIELDSIYYGKCYGYFLEAYIDDCIMPDPNVHKNYKNQRTAYSYFTDISRNLAIFFYVSEKTFKYISDNFDIRQNKEKGERFEEEITRIINRLNAMTKVLFENEYSKNMYYFIDEGENIKIINPVPDYIIKKFLVYRKYKMRLIGSGDGVSKTYALPYCGTITE